MVAVKMRLPEKTRELCCARTASDQRVLARELVRAKVSMSPKVVVMVMLMERGHNDRGRNLKSG